MVSCFDIQRAYVEVYRCMRKYIWGFDAVEALASLEVAVYQACPNLTEIRQCYYKLRQAVQPVISQDEELRASMSSFIDLADESNSAYMKLMQVREVVQNNENF